jgi:hypothetical protein
MSASVFALALAKRAERRNRIKTEAGQRLHAPSDAVKQITQAALLALGDKAKETQSTFVVAYLSSNSTYYACGIPETIRDELTLALKKLSGKASVEWVAKSGVNLHAEMAILKYLKDNKVVADKAHFGGDLTVVCIGKPVCADCCGLMTKYNIVHGAVCGEGSKQGWAHPFSGAVFRGEKEADFTYQKPGKYSGSATMMNQDLRQVSSSSSSTSISSSSTSN